MMHTAEDVHGIIAGKMALKYRGPELEAMKAIADAHQERSIQSFEKALATYTKGK
jgi:26S proteasome regulatory subunit N6